MGLTWIGYTDEDQEGTWKLTNGSNAPPEFDDFISSTINENCAVIKYSQKFNVFVPDDYNCILTLDYMCMAKGNQF